MKKSATVQNELMNGTLSNDEKLISFDINLLFTQIPLDLALATCG